MSTLSTRLWLSCHLISRPWYCMSFELWLGNVALYWNHVHCTLYKYYFGTCWWLIMKLPFDVPQWNFKIHGPYGCRINQHIEGCLKVQSSRDFPQELFLRHEQSEERLRCGEAVQGLQQLGRPAGTGVATIQSGRDFCWFSQAVLRVGQLRTWFSWEGHKPFPKRKVGWPWPI